MVSILEPRDSWRSRMVQDVMAKAANHPKSIRYKIQASRNDWNHLQFHTLCSRFRGVFVWGLIIKTSKRLNNNICDLWVFSEERTFKTWVLTRCSLILPRIPCNSDKQTRKIDRGERNPFLGRIGWFFKMLIIGIL